METTRGCVYFFRHIGLTPIKIGYSKSDSPIDRFITFKTYAPFGSEILGFVSISNAKEIENILHKKYANKRLSGEWFEISESEVQNEINFYSNISDIEEKNQFQIAWAKELQNRKNQLNIDYDEIKFKNISKFDEFKKIYLENKKLNRSHISNYIGVSRQTIINWIKEIDA